MSYNKTEWHDNAAPAIDAEHLNKIEQGIYDAQEMAQGGGSGLTNAIKTALLDCFQNVAWANGHGQDYYDALEEALNGGGPGPTPGPTLTSISAAYSGGSVAAGTPINNLKTNLVVTAHYSDSSTATITGYTLSGTIAVGTNTITVSYNGKTTTFNVTGTSASTFTMYKATEVPNSYTGILKVISTVSRQYTVIRFADKSTMETRMFPIEAGKTYRFFGVSQSANLHFFKPSLAEDVKASLESGTELHPSADSFGKGWAYNQTETTEENNVETTWVKNISGGKPAGITDEEWTEFLELTEQTVSYQYVQTFVAPFDGYVDTSLTTGTWDKIAFEEV